jgi:hypothetical protein
VKVFAFLVLVFSSCLEAKDIIFIGSPYSVVESKNSCNIFVESGICMDVAFEMKYNVVEWFNTSEEPETIEFIGFTHYSGLPKFTSFQYALIHLKKVKGYYLVKDVKPVVELGEEYTLCVDKELPYLKSCTQKQTVKSYLGSL